MPLDGEYLGMPVHIDDLDQHNQTFYRHCGDHQLHLQQCDNCGLKRYPPGTACPWCSQDQFTWAPVAGAGVVYSYGEIHHAIQPAFRPHAPYALLLVELDEQRGQPSQHEAIRMTGNLADADGNLAAPELVRQVGIGSRVRVVFNDIGDGIAIPLWQIDPDAQQPAAPWRYPIE